jgi:ferredoxin
MNRGVEKKVSTPYDEPSLVCVGCASCASVCPTGAIEAYEDESARVIWDKKFPLARCKRCGEVFGTAFEIRRAAQRLGSAPPELCEKCRRKAMADVMAETFGH